MAKAFSYTWDNAVWLGRMTERRLFMAIARGFHSAILRQNRAIKSLVKSSFELDDLGEIERAIEYAAATFDDDWEAQVDTEFVATLAAIAVEANRKNQKRRPRQQTRISRTMSFAAPGLPRTNAES